MAKAQGLRHYAPEASHLFETASKTRDADEAWISTSCRGLQYDAICSTWINGLILHTRGHLLITLVLEL